jgi:FAD:protein FMN transferase
MKYLVLITLTGILAFCSCKTKVPDMVKFTGQTQGTYYAVTYFDDNSRNFQPQIDSILKIFDQSASLWEPGSILSRINRNEPDVLLDPIFIELFNKSSEVYEKSGGAFDPTVGPLVNAWGFGFSDRLKVDQHVIDSLLPLVGYNKVSLQSNAIIKSDPRIQLDFNAIAQGYTVDLVAKFLSEKGISNYLIDIGGEVLGKGHKPDGEEWRVGIEKPKDNASYGEGLQAIVHLHNKALATSGSYRKFYEENGIRYSHTIDPVTGYPVKHTLLSSSVLAKDCATADAWATVFMVMGLEKSKSFIAGQNELDAYFIFTDENGNLNTYFTSGFGRFLVEESE